MAWTIDSVNAAPRSPYLEAALQVPAMGPIKNRDPPLEPLTSKLTKNLGVGADGIDLET